MSPHVDPVAPTHLCPQVILVAGAEHGRMTGVHARFPPKAGIQPGVHAGLGGTITRPWPTRAQARAQYRLGGEWVVNDPATDTSLGQRILGNSKLPRPGSLELCLHGDKPSWGTCRKGQVQRNRPASNKKQPAGGLPASCLRAHLITIRTSESRIRQCASWSSRFPPTVPYSQRLVW